MVQRGTTGTHIKRVLSFTKNLQKPVKTALFFQALLFKKKDLQ